MNLNAMFVFILISLGLFAVLFGLIPSDYYLQQPAYSVPTTSSKEVAAYFSANNLTLYSNNWAFNLNLGDRADNQSGLPDGHKVEVYFTDGIGTLDYVEVYHSFPSWFWTERHGIGLIDSELYKIDSSDYVNLQRFASQGIFFNQTLMDIAENGNSSILQLSCEHISLTLAIVPVNSTLSLKDSFAAGQLRFLSSYEIDFDAMKPSAWTLLTQLLTFQSPDLGIDGDGGTILNYLLAIAIWAMIVLLIFAAVTSVIPTISGWQGGG